ncbi:MAG: CHASE2 domain-containing protein [Nostocales cyanobacterium 94392]|nr:CHASE2 domain-containing protein [Nostocales cyanobacterium 94392]
MAHLHLKIQSIEQVCLFELSWGKGQHLSVMLFYPQYLTKIYQEWQECYLNFYQNSLRGRVADIGCIETIIVDWQAKLVQAEVKLLSEFHKWLRSAELYEIRTTISNIAKQQSPIPVTLFITCNCLELTRLPWEAWDINSEFSLSSEKIKIVRKPINIYQTVRNVKQKNRSQKIRVLAILGDDTDLDFQAEKQAIIKLNSIAYIEFISWQPGQNLTELKTKIRNTIVSKNGWDILFFAGHSNENDLTGGEISIAPNTTLSLTEITPAINIALERGLQFAIFNSCNGLSIANTLIDLGLSQVVVMREPIHNSVASEFLLLFLKSLGQFKDVYEALSTVSQYFKLEKNLEYPSAYLIPSLFCHPEVSLFRLEPFGLQKNVKKMIPSRYEIIAISSLILISLQLPVQKFLLERRLLTQAIYRQITGQIPTSSNPPVLLVQIDEKSIQKAKISNPRPMNRKYLASLVDRLVQYNAKIIGINYLLDRHQEKNDEILATSIRNGVNQQNPTWFIFAATRAANGEQLEVLPQIASTNWSLQGELDILPGYMQLSSLSASQPELPHFTHLIAQAQQLQRLYSTAENFREKPKEIPQPKLNSQINFLQRVNSFIQSHNNKTGTLKDLNSSIMQSPLQPIREFSYYLGQMWLHPIVDYSIPPKQIYHRISAWQLLKNEQQNNNKHQITIITPGGYGEAGISVDGEDNFELPPAIEYWQNLENSNASSSVMTGGEVQAYILHHLLEQRLLVPIPDLWMIGIAIFVGKYLSFQIQKNRWKYLLIVVASTTIYGLVSLQIYLSPIAIVIPWLLPSATLCIYILPALQNQTK